MNEGGRISGALKISKTKDEESERGVGVWMSFPHSALHSALPPVLLSGDDDDDVEEEEEKRRDAPMTQQQQQKSAL